MSREGIQAINEVIRVHEANLRVAETTGDAKTAAELRLKLKELERDKTILGIHTREG